MSSQVADIQWADTDDDVPLLVDLDLKAQSLSSREKLLPSLLVPVTILSGFLGSGKTTLVQYILSNNTHGKKIAVIENEYGEGLQIESLIARDGATGDSLTDLVELPNGCVCCTVKDSLVTALETLLERRPDLEHILIEASGMANPGPIATLFWVDEGLSRLKMDGIVTVVDAFHIEQQLQTTQEASQQIAYADRILLNKIDLLGNDQESKVLQLRNVVQRLNPSAEVKSTTHSVIPDLNWILNNRSLDGNEDESKYRCFVCDVTTQHEHTQKISTVSLVYDDTSVDYQRMNRWLAQLLWPNQDESNQVLMKRLEDVSAGHVDPRNISSNDMEIFRLKGILSVGYDDRDEEVDPDHLFDSLDKRKFIVQGVYDLWDVSAANGLEWGEEERRSCKMVIIGRNLDEQCLREGLESCIFR